MHHRGAKGRRWHGPEAKGRLCVKEESYGRGSNAFTMSGHTILSTPELTTLVPRALYSIDKSIRAYCAIRLANRVNCQM